MPLILARCASGAMVSAVFCLLAPGGVGCGGTGQSACVEGGTAVCQCGALGGTQRCLAEGARGPCECGSDTSMGADVSAGDTEGDTAVANSYAVHAVGTSTAISDVRPGPRLQVSGNGDCAVFEHSSEGTTQVYLVDLDSGAVEPVSVNHGGGVPSPTRASGLTEKAVIDGTAVSDDCRYVVFYSLMPLDRDVAYPEGDDARRVYVRDRELETTTLVSPPPTAERTNDYVRTPSMTRDGRFVLYTDHEEGLVHNFVGPHELFVWDRQTGERRWLQIRRADGSPMTRAMTTEASFIAADGRYVFTRAKRGDVGLTGEARDNTWLRVERESGEWEEVQLKHDTNDSVDPFNVSADGRYVLFATSDPVVDAVVPPQTQVYLLDIKEGDYTVVSKDLEGQPNNPSKHVPLSHDGRVAVIRGGFEGGPEGGGLLRSLARVELESNTWQFLPHNQRGVTEAYLGLPAGGDYPSVNSDGSVVVFRCGDTVTADPPPENWIGLCVWRGAGGAGPGCQAPPCDKPGDSACQALVGRCADCTGDDRATCEAAVASGNEAVCGSLDCGAGDSACAQLAEACETGCSGLEGEAAEIVQDACEQHIEDMAAPDQGDQDLCAFALDPIMTTLCADGGTCREALSRCDDGECDYDCYDKIETLARGDCGPLSAALDEAGCSISACASMDCDNCLSFGELGCQDARDTGDEGVCADYLDSGSYTLGCTEWNAACIPLVFVCNGFDEPDDCVDLVGAWVDAFGSSSDCGDEGSGGCVDRAKLCSDCSGDLVMECLSASLNPDASCQGLEPPCQ